MGYFYERFFQPPLFPEPNPNSKSAWFQEQAIRELTANMGHMLRHEMLLLKMWEDACKSDPQSGGAVIFPFESGFSSSQVSLTCGGFLVYSSRTVVREWEHQTSEGTSRRKKAFYQVYQGYPWSIRSEVDKDNGSSYVLGRGRKYNHIPPALRYRYQYKWPVNDTTSSLMLMMPTLADHHFCDPTSTMPFIYKGGVAYLFESLDPLVQARTFVRELVRRV